MWFYCGSKSKAITILIPRFREDENNEESDEESRITSYNVCYTKLLRVFLGIIVDRVFWSTDQIILGAVKGSEAVAVYSVGINFYIYLITFSSVFSSMLLPRFTQISLTDFDMKETNKLFIKISRLRITSYNVCYTKLLRISR